MLRIRVPALGDGAAPSGEIVGTAAGIATAEAVGAAYADATGSSAGVATTAAVGAANADGAGAAAGTGTAPGVGASYADGVGTAAGSSTASGVAPSFADGVGTAAGSSTALAVSASPDQEALPSGGFLPDDWEERERRRRAIRKTLEGVIAPKPAQVAREIREAVAPAQEPPAVTMRDAVSPETMEKLRRLADSAMARQAMDDDDEDVLMLVSL